MTAVTIPFSAASERNKEPIEAVLQPYLEQVDSVLEIGSGTGQHALHFASRFPKLNWQTSDQLEYLPGVSAQLENANMANALAPLELNVQQTDWAKGETFSAIFTANTFHIMTQSDVEAFFSGLVSVSKPRALLFVYGPFKYKGEFTSESNRDFDQVLRARNCGSAIRDFETINGLAQQAGFDLVEDRSMPANNQCLIWQRSV